MLKPHLIRLVIYWKCPFFSLFQLHTTLYYYDTFPERKKV